MTRSMCNRISHHDSVQAGETVSTLTASSSIVCGSHLCSFERKVLPYRRLHSARIVTGNEDKGEVLTPGGTKVHTQSTVDSSLQDRQLELTVGEQ